MAYGTRNTTPRRLLRTLARCAALAVAVALLVPVLPWPAAPLVVPAASPFVMLASVVATRRLSVVAVIGLCVLLVALRRRRWFCRWACPVGLMTDGAGWLSPVSTATFRPVPRIGRYLVLLCLGAALVGYPLFLWLDPLAIWSGAFGWVRGPSGAAATVSALALAGLMILSFLWPGIWCLKLCPLGATQELLALPGRWFRVAGPASVPSSPADERATVSLPRRSVLAMAFGALWVAAGVPLGLLARAAGSRVRPVALRPPGAAAPWQFGQLCLRCGNCVRACPAGIIGTGWGSESASGWLTPALMFDSDYCREDCVACTAVCPSGALKPLRLESKALAPIGVAHVLMDRCLLALGNECRAMCLEACPYEAITRHEWTWEDDRLYPIILADRCPGCGACQVACTPMRAIVVLAQGQGPEEWTTEEWTTKDTKGTKGED